MKYFSKNSLNSLKDEIMELGEKIRDTKGFKNFKIPKELKTKIKKYIKTL